MPKVSTIDRHALAKVIRPALDKKLKELSEELGVQLTTGSGQYGYTTGFLKIEIATITEDGQVLTPERDAFLKYHGVYDLPKEALDAIIKMGSEEFRIAGINTKARKNNVVLEKTDNSGRKAVAPASAVLAAYNMQHVYKRAS
ncbi:hypothetical protein DET61_1192 [Marinobacter nauticus]|uniref:Uncharacterized protein n=1 Tax=Marinobacter nauticus TaxID=2743 RepID=A0A368X5Y8_MARNT|nr:hypothetical protein [Marinobacter nauticus]RCW63235.1 hypothetical protein DET61_1192 [Marinobacter nauticus]